MAKNSNQGVEDHREPFYAFCQAAPGYRIGPPTEEPACPSPSSRSRSDRRRPKHGERRRDRETGHARERLAEGLIFHTAGWDEGTKVFRIFDVWETQEDSQRVQDERLIPIMQGAGAPPDRSHYYEIHHLVQH